MAKWYATDEEAETAAKVAALGIQPAPCPQCGDPLDLETLIGIAEAPAWALEAEPRFRWCRACAPWGW